VTDRQTLHDSKDRAYACIASRDKNCSWVQFLTGEVATIALWKSAPMLTVLPQATSLHGGTNNFNGGATIKE